MVTSKIISCSSCPRAGDGRGAVGDGRGADGDMKRDRITLCGLWGEKGVVGGDGSEEFEKGRGDRGVEE